MANPEELFKAIRNSTLDDSDESLGMLKVLDGAGAIGAFAMIQKDHPESLMSVLAYEQMEFLKKGGVSSDLFDVFLAGQASLAKYMIQALKYVKHVDNLSDSSENINN